MCERKCHRCGVSSLDAMIGNTRVGDQLKPTCYECDGEIEREWVNEDPANNRHSLDTFSPRDYE